MKIAMFNFALAAAVVCASAFAKEDEQPAKKTITPEERAARMERMLVKTGGIVERVGEGKLVFVNCQDLIPEADLKENVDRIQHLLHYSVELRKGAWSFGTKRPDDSAVAVFIVNDEKLPMSLLAIEERWGVVNVAGLKLGKRYEKELTRVTSLAMGSWRSQFKASALQVVNKPADLDKLSPNIAMDSATAIFAVAKEYGMTKSEKTTYLKACQEGWATAPTNKYQEAIWKQTHTLPSAPLKLEKPAK